MNRYTSFRPSTRFWLPLFLRTLLWSHFFLQGDDPIMAVYWETEKAAPRYVGPRPDMTRQQCQRSIAEPRCAFEFFLLRQSVKEESSSHDTQTPH